MSKYGRRWGFGLLMGSLVMSLGMAFALAASTVTTIGTAGDDRIHGSRGPDIIYGKQGDDVAWTGTSGELGTDTGRFSEYVYGGTGDDSLRSWSEAQGPAYLDGGPGFDECKLSPNDTAVNCEVELYKDGPDREVVVP